MMSGKQIVGAVLWLLAAASPVGAGEGSLDSRRQVGDLAGEQPCHSGQAEWVLAMHGGVLTRPWHPKAEARKAAMAPILQRGGMAIEGGASALEVVAAVIVEMEDQGIFNAGSGAILNQAGEREMDASIMEGTTQMSGAVASIRKIKNPILGAKHVMEETDNVLFVGPAADSLLAAAGLELAELPTGGSDTRRAALGPPEETPLGTVGAVALDRCGDLAAGTSTGGFDSKIPGRVGDSPLVGAGTWASLTVAVSASGHGEYFIRYAAAHDIHARMAYGGRSLADAAGAVVSELFEKGGIGGVIALDRQGRVAMPHSTPGMLRGVVGANQALEVKAY